jgi:F-type H+-transporting ATPase subunit b
MEIQLYQLLFQFINFGVILFFLSMFLYKPILNILDQRAERIDQGLLAAQKNLEEKARIEILKTTILANAEKEATSIVEQAKNDAQKLTEKMLADAKAQAQLSTQKEAAAFALRLKDQESKLTAKMSDFIVLTTKNLLKDSLSQKYQDEIFQHQVSVLKKVTVN